jgi:4-amino-4-deoxy-L-arabinose transferase-like glycosyltransferase
LQNQILSQEVKKEWIAFCLIICLGLILRFSGLCFDSLWLDESYQSLAGASGHGPADFTSERNEKFLFHFAPPAPVPQMLQRFRSVDPLCPPLYALLLNRWITLFGAGDFTLRSLSAILSALSLLATFIFCRTWLGVKAALFAILLLAVSPFDIHYAQEARMYSLVMLLSLISTSSLLLFLRDFHKKGKIWPLPLYTVATCAAINSHYTALFLAAAQGCATTIYLCYRKSYRQLALMTVSWLSVALLWLPWVPMFLQSAGSRKESFYVSRTPDLIWPIKTLFLRLPLNWLIFLSGQRVVAYAAGLYATSACLLLAAARSTFSRDNDKRGELLALWVWALLPALGLWLIDVVENHRVVEVARYVIYTAPAISMLAGWGLASLLPNKKVFYAVLSLHLVFAACNLFYTHTVKQREPWQQMAETVEKLVPPDEMLVISQHYDIACLDRYLPQPRLQLGMSPAMGRDVVQTKLKAFKSFALITAQDGESIKDLVPGSFKIKQQVDLSHGLHLRLYVQ